MQTAGCWPIASTTDLWQRVKCLVRLAFVMAIALVISACDEEHRAVSPGGVSDFATAVANGGDRESTIVETDDDIPQVFGQRLLPEAEWIYFANGGDIWQIGRVGSPRPVIEGLDVVSFSATARGDRLALLSVDREDDSDEETATLSVIVPSSEARHDIGMLIEQAFDENLGAIESISATPDGSALAISYQSGALVVAGLDGTVQLVQDESEGQHPGRVRWSADGQLMLYLDPAVPSEPSELLIALPGQGVRQTLITPEEGTSGVVDAHWIPGTTKIACVVSSAGTIRHGGDLFLVDAMSGSQELLISSGQIAPVAGVVDIAVSPGGERIALTMFVPGNPLPEYAGLWVVNLESRSAVEVEIDPEYTVSDLWWLGEELLFRAIDEPRTALPGTYTGLESFKIFEYHPVMRVLRERYDDQDEVDDD